MDPFDTIMEKHATKIAARDAEIKALRDALQDMTRAADALYMNRHSGKRLLADTIERVTQSADRARAALSPTKPEDGARE